MPLDQLAGRDRVTILDVRGARTIVPPMPASNRSMAMAALEAHVRSRSGVAPRDVPGAFAAAARAIGTSKVTQRVLVLAEINELPVAEIADLEGIPVGTAASRLRLARERFRTLLARRKTP